MKWVAKIIVAVLLNAVALIGAATYIPGFTLEGDLRQTVGIAVVLTVLNFVLKPILKLFLGPVIILTLGLGLILVNAFIFYILDFMVKNLTIETIPALIYTAIMFGCTNFIFHLATKN